MGVQAAPSAPVSTQATVSKNKGRQSANFPPCVWGDHFISYTDEPMETHHYEKIKLLELKEEITRKLIMVGDDTKNPLQKLELIDSIQRLGVAYHFEVEIDEVLEKIHKDFNVRDDYEHDLYSSSLWFRLLREHGCQIPSAVFKKFKDDNGNFKEFLKTDAKGMLALYEAAHLRVNGETILDEALDFTTAHLASIATGSSNNWLTEPINHALNRPLHKSLQRLEARFYIPIYQQDPLHNEALLTFAKLDFNILQRLHQKELSEIVRWWKELDFKEKLPFARDRIVECYFWILGVYFEPKYYLARRILTKVVAVTSTIDDIYDVYGTIEELEHFTEAVERWDVGAMNQLPQYMKHFYGALLDVYKEIKKDVAFGEKSYCLHYAKEAMKNIVRSYFMEAKWCHQKYVPTMEEYMEVARISSGYFLLSTTSFVGMGDVVTKEAFEWLFSYPKFVKASAVIARLMDDIASHKFEQNREHVASAVECFMKQNGISEEKAKQVLLKEVEYAWKDMNEGMLGQTSIPMPLLERIINLARVIYFLYKDGDCYTNSHLVKHHVASILKDPVLL